MRRYDKVIFVARSGNCREPMAAGILQDLLMDDTIEVAARGLVVAFPEPMNQKAEAVLVSNGIYMKDFSSTEIEEEDFSDRTLVLTMEATDYDKLLSRFPMARNVFVLTEYVGDELEILDPYGGALPAYGLCYETLRKSIKKLVKLLNEGE